MLSDMAEYREMSKPKPTYDDMSSDGLSTLNSLESKTLIKVMNVQRLNGRDWTITGTYNNRKAKMRKCTEIKEDKNSSSSGSSLVQVIETFPVKTVFVMNSSSPDAKKQTIENKNSNVGRFEFLWLCLTIFT
eukprot:10396112-Ditylum_brightwellii.AAC.1